MKTIDAELEMTLQSLKPMVLTEDQLARFEGAIHHSYDQSEHLSLESDLASYQPVELNSDQLDSMQSAMELTQIEDYLGGFSPEGMPTELLQRMEDAMDGWQKHTPENLVEFNSQESTSARKSSNSLVWSSAAAIIVLCAVGFVLSQGHVDSGVTDLPVATTTTDVNQSEEDNLVDITSGEHSNNIINVSNEGVVVTEDIPHRIMKVHYEEVYKVRDASGRIYEVRQPKVKIVLVPVKSN